MDVHCANLNEDQNVHMFAIVIQLTVFDTITWLPLKMDTWITDLKVV